MKNDKYMEIGNKIRKLEKQKFSQQNNRRARKKNEDKKSRRWESTGQVTQDVSQNIYRLKYYECLDWKGPLSTQQNEGNLYPQHHDI